MKTTRPDFLFSLKTFEDLDEFFLFRHHFEAEEVSDMVDHFQDLIKGEDHDLFASSLKVCLNNIVRHRDKPDFANQTNNRKDILAYTKRDQITQISYSNMIDKDKGEVLARLLESKNTEKLKSILNSVDHYNYNYSPINYYFMEFRLDLFLGGKLNLFRNDLHHYLHEDNVLFFYKGDFSQDKFLSIFSALKQLKQDKRVNKKLLYIFMEMFQNIVKHSASEGENKNGIIGIYEKNGKHSIFSENLVDSEEHYYLNDYFSKVTNSSEEDIQKWVLNSMNSGNNQTGLLDIKRFSNGDMAFNLSPHLNKYKLFLNVSL